MNSIHRRVASTLAVLMFSAALFACGGPDTHQMQDSDGACCTDLHASTDPLPSCDPQWDPDCGAADGGDGGTGGGPTTGTGALDFTVFNYDYNPDAAVNASHNLRVSVYVGSVLTYQQTFWAMDERSGETRNAVSQLPDFTAFVFTVDEVSSTGALIATRVSISATTGADGSFCNAFAFGVAQDSNCSTRTY